jgi:hypothetical protein
MSKKSSVISATLIKYRKNVYDDFSWFWIDAKSGAALSKHFESQEDAETWFNGMITIHNETYSLLDRVMNGGWHTVSARVDLSAELPRCPYTSKYEDDMMHVTLIARDKEEAKKRVEQYYQILEWEE